MRKILKRILIGTVLTTIISVVTIVTLILNPQILFAEKKVHGDFNIYSNNDIPDSYQTTIDNAVELIRTSEIYEPNQKLDIFISDGTIFNELDTKILGYALAKCIHNNIILKVEADFDKNILVGWNTKRNLKKTIAHEAMHFYQMKKYGVMKFNPFNHPPMWKLEGYPEYIANQADIKSVNYRLIDSITKLKEFEKTGENLIETEPGQLDPLVYFKGRVMMEYLIDIKRMTYSEILSNDLTEDKVIEEMTSWYIGQKNKEE
jgi:hypothetical protein